MSGFILFLLGGEVPKNICLKGETLRHLNPDERTTAALLKKALALEATPEWSMSTSGIFVRTGGLSRVLDDLKSVRMIYLREDGADIRSLGPGALAKDAAFILGDHTGMTPEEETMISEAGAEVVSLGPTSLHADHCVVLINNELDRIEKEESL